MDKHNKKLKKKGMMKKLGLVVATAFITCSVMMAQGPRGDRNMDPKQRAQEMTEQMVKAYALNDDQKEKVQTLNLEMMQKMSENRNDDREARRAKMQTVREDYNKKLKEVLTDEQYKKYAKDEADRQQRMRNR